MSFKPEKGDNWFITLQGGGNTALAFGSGQKFNDCCNFVDRLGVSAGIGVGKWHNPYFATRLMVDYNWLSNPHESR